MLNLMKLESRIVLDGAAAGDVSDHDTAQTDAFSDHVESGTDGLDAHVPDFGPGDADDASAAAGILLSDGETAPEAMNVVLVSDRLPDYQTLADAAVPGARVVVFDAAGSSAAEILQDVVSLSQDSGQPIGSVTLISHGGTDFVQLGTDLITTDSLAQQSALLGELGEAMSADAQIHLYGCNVAAAGQDLLNQLAAATGADVYASDDITGNGGDWVLEASSDGAPTAVVPLSPDVLAGYQDDLQNEVIFPATSSAFGFEDAENSFLITIYVEDGITDSQLTVTANPVNPNDAVLPNQPLDITLRGPYNPSPTQPQPPAGYHGYQYFAVYTPESNAFHANTGVSSQIEVQVTYGSSDFVNTYAVNVTPQNDAPVLTPGTDITHTVEEGDTNPQGVSLDANLDSLISDVDVTTNSPNNPGIGLEKGVAIIGADNTRGEWQYRVNNGAWTDLPDDLSADSALLMLTENTDVRFVPEGQWAESDAPAQLTFVAWDGATGTNGTRVDTTVGPRPGIGDPGDTSAFSQTAGTISVTVTPVNQAPDAPTVRDITYVENTSPVHLDVTLGDDPDDTHMSGAVIEFTDNFQAGEDAFNYTPIHGITIDAAQSTASRLVLTGRATIQEYNEAINSITYGNSLEDDPTEGGRNEYSGTPQTRIIRGFEVTVTDENSSGAGNGVQSASDDAELDVDAINDAPDLDASTGEMAYREGAGEQLVDGGMLLDDIDDDSITRAEVRITTPLGDQENLFLDENQVDLTQISDTTYRLQIGNTVLTVEKPNSGTLIITGLARKSDYQAALRAVTYENGRQDLGEGETDTSQIAYTITDNNSRTWGTGQSGTGGFMTDTETITVTMEGIHTPPTQPDAREMDNIYEDNQGPPYPDPDPDGEFDTRPNTGNSMSEIISPFTDPDNPGVELRSGAISAVDNTNGTWEFSTDGGATWQVVDTARLDGNTALLLGESARIRFTPSEHFNTGELQQTPTAQLPEVTIHSWDRSAGSEGDYVTIANNGSLSATGTDVGVQVVAVNDKPQLDGVPDRAEIDIDDPAVTIDGITLADVDIQRSEGNGLMEVTLSAEHGTINLAQTAGLTFTAGGNGQRNMTFTGTMANAQAAMATLTYNPDADTLADFQQSGSVNDQFDALALQVNDTGNFGLPGVRSTPDGLEVAIFLGNTAPTVDLDPDDDGGGEPPIGPSSPDNTGTGNINVTFIEDARCTPIMIADANDPNQLIVERDGDDIVWMEIRLTNPQEGDLLSADVAGTALQIVFNGIEEGTGDLVLRVEGAAADAVYDQVLRTAMYDNTSQNPDGTRRIIEVRASDEYDAVNNPAAISRISVVPVNDAPVNTTPSEVSTEMNTDVVFDNISVADPDVAGGEVQVVLQVDFGRVTVNANTPGVAVGNNGSSRVTVQGAVDAVNAALSGMVYTPLTDFEGNDTIIVTTNDLGNTGINPNDVTSQNGLCVVADGVLDDNGGVVTPPNAGTPDDPSSQADTDTILVRVSRSDVDIPPEIPGGPGGPPTLPIVRPAGEALPGAGPGPVILPGPVGETAGPAGTRLGALRAMAESGRGLMQFCSLEPSLNLGCRFANTLDPEAQFGSVQWEDLGQSRPFLDEEYDLYSRLFIQEEGDPGFNVEAGVFDTNLGGMAPSPTPVTSGEAEGSLNSLGGGDAKAAFFTGREDMDRTGRGPEPESVS